MLAMLPVTLHDDGIGIFFRGHDRHIPAIAEKIRAAEEDLKDSGRVVIRYSGTEHLARVMIEAESEELMRKHADAIAEAIRSELGI